MFYQSKRLITVYTVSDFFSLDVRKVTVAEGRFLLLKHLPNDAQLTLLNILNNVWALGKFPTSWCTSTVIPVPKPGKDTSDPSNYRPIALTSCICKVMERMINSRLVWYLERNKIISPMQCGFRKERSTTDYLVRLESFVREAFVQR